MEVRVRMAEALPETAPKEQPAGSSRAEEQESAPPARGRVVLMLGALGVVYGDIGTSPLYTGQFIFTAHRNAAHATVAGVYGIASLVFWTLMIEVSLKYAGFIMRAHNRGDGGIMALTALVQRKRIGRTFILVTLGIFGAGLFFGDGMITPAISVTSAIVGLNVVSPSLAHLVVPLSLAILVGTSGPLDQFIVSHPRYLLEHPVEEARTNPDNLLILASHLKCAAFELPLRDGEAFGPATLPEILAYLEEERVLHHAVAREAWVSRRGPVHLGVANDLPQAVDPVGVAAWAAKGAQVVDRGTVEDEGMPNVVARQSQGPDHLAGVIDGADEAGLVVQCAQGLPYTVLPEEELVVIPRGNVIPGIVVSVNEHLARGIDAGRPDGAAAESAVDRDPFDQPAVKHGVRHDPDDADRTQRRTVCHAAAPVAAKLHAEVGLVPSPVLSPLRYPGREGPQGPIASRVVS